MTCVQLPLEPTTVTGHNPVDAFEQLGWAQVHDLTEPSPGGMRGVPAGSVQAVKRSAGLLLFRRSSGPLEVLLAHPGGPLFARRNDVWTIPKGEYGDSEEPRAAAYREFAEEIGSLPPDGEPLPLGEITQRSGKQVTAWALEGDLDVTTVASNTFPMVWPPRSGRLQHFPEVDRAQWFDVGTAGAHLLAAQLPLVERLVALLAG